jgi:hypothetical protein
LGAKRRSIMHRFGIALAPVLCLVVTTTSLIGQTLVQGDVSGAWTKAGSPYIIIATTIVPAGQTLTIEHGVVVKIGLGISFRVNGTLNAAGTIADSILFTSTENPPAVSQWGGIIDSGSVTLQYCSIRYGGAGNLSALSNPGPSSILRVRESLISNNYSGVALWGSNSWISNSVVASNTVVGTYLADGTKLDSCEIRENLQYGVYIHQGNVTVSNCRVHKNSTAGGGSGIVLVGSQYVTSVNSKIDSNQNIGMYVYLSGSLSISHSQILSNGYGIYGTGTTATIDSSAIAGNVYDGMAANGQVLLRHTLISANGGNGVSNPGAGSIIENNTIRRNAAGIVQLASNSAVLVRNNIVAGNSGTGLGTSITPAPTVKFNDVYGNTPNFSGFSSFYGDTTLGPRNKNGLKCDPFSNINSDPLFLDTVNNDFRLKATSPCINAGDTLSSRDPDSTTADIGAFYRNQLTSVDNHEIAVPRNFVLWQNHPNPFNPTTEIGIAGVGDQASGANHVRLVVYDLLGREVAVLVDEGQSPGSYRVTFDASSLPSGVYFYRLTAGNFVQTRRMILVR